VPGSAGRASGRADSAELRLIFEISQTLDESMDLRDVVGQVLKGLARLTAMRHATLTLLNRDTGELVTDASYGLTADQIHASSQKVISRVISSGRSAIVDRGSGEPIFLGRGESPRRIRKDELHFLCVPIKLGNQAIGALSADRLFPEPASCEEDARLLSVIASMIAQAVRLRRRAQEERQRLLDENRRLQEQLKDRFRPSNIIGSSGAMQAVYDMIAQVSKSDATVLIRGESGVGKELVAQAVHYNSLRAQKPFVKVNCAALPETIIESELFGHEKGAFTGALAERKGRFELAEGGTIFLDEIGDFSPATQIKLLRVLQEREFERVGAATPIKADVRIIAATNRDLEALIAEGRFRQDLYYRLNVFPIHVPPLRERRSDILLLADYFVEKHSRRNHKSVRRISTPAIDMLSAYHWPGNVRELENCIERAVLLTTDDVIHGHHLPPTLQTAEASGTAISETLEAALANLEREMLAEAIKSSRGNMAKAARGLGISERLIGLRVTKYGIDFRRFRTSRTHPRTPQGREARD
jgi:Nif-specific regulatory protein